MNGLCWWLEAPRSLPTDCRPGRRRRVDDVVLARPGAAQLDELPARVGQVERGAHGGRRGGSALGAVVRDPGAPGDDRVVAEDRVRELDTDAARCVGEDDLEGVRLIVGLDVRRRQAVVRGSARLAGHDAVLRVGEVEDARAVGQLDGQARDAVVAAARRRVFEGDRFADAVREAGELGRLEVRVRPIWCERRPEMQVAERPVRRGPA